MEENGTNPSLSDEASVVKEEVFVLPVRKNSVSKRSRSNSPLVPELPDPNPSPETRSRHSSLSSGRNSPRNSPRHSPGKSETILGRKNSRSERKSSKDHGEGNLTMGYIGEGLRTRSSSHSQTLRRRSIGRELPTVVEVSEPPINRNPSIEEEEDEDEALKEKKKPRRQAKPRRVASLDSLEEAVTPQTRPARSGALGDSELESKIQDLQLDGQDANMKARGRDSQAFQGYLPHLTTAFGVLRGKCIPPCSCRYYAPSEVDGICKCDHWPANHEDLGPPPCLLGDLVSNSDLLVQKLLNVDLKLIFLLSEHVPIPDYELLSKALVCIFDFYQQAPRLIQFSLQNEIHPNDLCALFREDRFSFRILSNYLKTVGQEWLKITVGPVITSLLHFQGSFEINPFKLNHLKDRKGNGKRLKKLVQHFCDAIFKSVSKAPGKMRMLCSLVRKQMEIHFPDSVNLGLATLLFLRFICPAICNPHSHGLIDRPLSEDARRGLVLAAKILQNMSINVKFGNKEEYMTSMEALVDLNSNSMNNFLYSICITSDPSSIPDFRFLNVEKDEAINHIRTVVQASGILRTIQV